MPDNFDKVVGLIRDENGELTQFVVENEDHSISHVSLPVSAPTAADVTVDASGFDNVVGADVQAALGSIDGQLGVPVDGPITQSDPAAVNVLKGETYIGGQYGDTTGGIDMAGWDGHGGYIVIFDHYGSSEGTIELNGTDENAHIKVGGHKVLGAQGAAVADATDAASAITQLNALLARLRAHGIIAT